jgi:glutamine amidotransferase
MSARLPTRLTGSLRELGAHGGRTDHHADGWGVALYGDEDVALFREPAAGSDSALMRFLEAEGPCTSSAIAHIRHATRGSIALKNTQPFVRELAGRVHVFAHNGDLSDIGAASALRCVRFKAVGETDSEHAFCALLERLSTVWQPWAGIPSLDARMSVVSRFAAELRALGPANFLYSDGDVLFAHAHRRMQRDSRRIAPPGLYALSRRCPAQAPDRAPCARAQHPGSQETMLLSSVPLTGEAWHPLPEAAVVALSAGRIVAEMRPFSTEARTAPPPAAY